MNKAQIFFYIVAVATITCGVYLYTSIDVHAPATNPLPQYNANETNNQTFEENNEVPLGQSNEIVASGTVDMSIVTETKYPLIDTNWRWLRTESATGTIVSEPLSSAPFLLKLSADTTMSSQTDCNTINGSFTQSADELIFGPLMSTKMFCENSIENEYVEQLSLVESYSITDNMLRLNLSNESGTMFFVRTK